MFDTNTYSPDGWTRIIEYGLYDVDHFNVRLEYPDRFCRYGVFCSKDLWSIPVGMVFKNSEFVNCKLGDQEGVTYENCVFGRVQMEGSLYNVTFKNCKIHDVWFTGSMITDTAFTNVHLAESGFIDQGLIYNLKIKDSKMVEVEIVNTKLYESIFDHSELINSNISVSNISQLKISRCKLDRFNISKSTINELLNIFNQVSDSTIEYSDVYTSLGVGAGGQGFRFDRKNGNHQINYLTLNISDQNVKSEVKILDQIARVFDQLKPTSINPSQVRSRHYKEFKQSQSRKG